MMLTFAEAVRQLSNELSLKRLSAMEDYDEIWNYLHEELGLYPAGDGSSRSVWIVGPRTVLKVAKNDRGLVQNEQEAKVSRDPRASVILPRMYRAGRNHRYMVAEIARPLSGIVEWEHLSGLDWEDMGYLMWEAKGKIYAAAHWLLNQFGRGVARAIGEPIGQARGVKAPPERSAQMLDALGYLRDEYDLMPGDTTVIEHWGKTPRGRLVLIDAGLTQAQFEELYT